MTDARHDRVCEIFLAACDLQGAVRAAYVDDACGGDADLRAEVLGMLAGDESAADVDRPVVEPGWLRKAGRIEGAPTDGAETIDDFEILGVLGEGGMGTVYRARQAQPQRVVALKVLRPGALSSTVIRRFEHEAEVLGRLRHPGIAQVYQAGTADGGRGAQPYIAMELIEGAPITRDAASRQLDVTQRLEVLAEVCDAVHYAHQQGVIHRDLKPGNILVDEHGRPRILDFGIARATNSDVRFTTMHTAAGQLVGTIPYMSPEQVAGDPEAVDVRSDVYALGVLAYELMAGALPHQFENKSLAEAVVIIRDDEPSMLGSVDRSLRGDVETIVARALEKDRTSRYQQAADLAADIRRHLRHEAIVARPPSLLYQASKLARRHRAVAGALAAVFLVFVAATIVSSLFAIDAVKERNIARDERAVAQNERNLAQAARDTAVVQESKAREVNTLLTRLLGASNPYRVAEQTHEELSVFSLLERMRDELDATPPDDPEVEAMVRHTLGNSFYGVWRLEDADREATRALELYRTIPGAQLEVTGTVLLVTGIARDSRDLERAERLLEDLLARREAERWPDDENIATALGQLGLIRRDQGRLDEAESLLRDSLDIARRTIGEDSLRTAVTVGNLAAVLRSRNDYAGADESYREALRLLEAHEADAGIYGGVTAKNYARLLELTERRQEAETWYRRAVDTLAKHAGPDHLETCRVRNNLAMLLTDLGRNEESEAMLLDVMETLRARFGENDGDYITAQSNRAFVLWDLGRYEESADAYLLAAENNSRYRGPDDYRVPLFRAYAAEGLARVGRFVEAEGIALASYDHAQQLADNDAVVARILTSIITVYRDWDRADMVAKYEAMREDSRSPDAN